MIQTLILAQFNQTSCDQNIKHGISEKSRSVRSQELNFFRYSLGSLFALPINSGLVRYMDCTAGGFANPYHVGSFFFEIQKIDTDYEYY